MNILITGGNGFLGSNLTRHFVNKGCKIGLILRKKSFLGRINDLIPQVSFISNTSYLKINDFIGTFNPDVILHCACSYGRNSQTFSDLLEANVALGFRILDSLTHSAKAVAFINIGTALAKNTSLYALSKNLFSDYAYQVNQLVNNSHLKFINISLQHMYGADDDLSKFTSFIVNQCMLNQKKIDLTMGDQRRDFIYIDDVVSAFDILISKLKYVENGESIDLGSGTAPTIREFVQTVKELTKATTTLNFGALPYRESEPMLCQADVCKISSLGWQPQFTLRQGLSKVIEKELKT